MYRANLYLYPHTHHSKTSTVPGAYPSAVIKGNNSTDFMRTIQLNVENPTQPIGRSSRNEAKGLFAARNNGFFESPVMSRAHAEVRMTLEPRRKITIRDTNSMHGTFVNGLQLRSAETAELQQGTEVTFGAEVTRCDEVFPAKTFRCEVEWERLRSPSPCQQKLSADTKPRNGYGLSEDLVVSEYDSNEDDGFDEDVLNQSDNNDERMTSGSGRSSPAVSDCSSTDPEASTVSSSCWRHNDEPLGNKEQSYKESSEHVAARTVSELSSHNTKLSYDGLESGSVLVSEKLRQRMPTIHSLVHKTPVGGQGSVRTPSKTPWAMNITDHLLEIEKPSCLSMDTSKEAPMDHSESREGDPKETVQNMIDFDAGVKNCTSDLENRDIQKKKAISLDKSVVEVQNHGQAQTFEADNMFGVDIATSPIVMSSKICDAGWAGISNAESFSPVREAPSLPPLKKLTPPASTVRNYAGGSHTHWSTADQSSMIAFMDSKREFFDARAKNFAKVREQDVEPGHVLFPTPPALSQFSPWSEWSVKSQLGNLAAPDSKPKEVKCRLQAIASKKPGFLSVKFHDKQKGIAMQNEDKPMVETNQDDDNQDFDNSYVMTESGEDDACNDDNNFDDDEDYGNYYEDPECEDDTGSTTIESQHMSAEDTSLNMANTDSQTGENSKIGYSKFSIDDMMNHESPIISGDQVETTGSAPSSEKSTAAFDVLDKSKVGTALQDILNPAALLTPPPTLKRKRPYTPRNEQLSSPTPQSLSGLQVHELDNDSILQDAPEVVNSNLVADYPELAVEQVQTNGPEYYEERSRKRVKVQNNGGNNFLRLATATLAGAVVGGVGVFAALVATAQ